MGENRATKKRGEQQQVQALLPQLTTEWRQATVSDALRALIVTELKHLRDDPAELERLLAPR